MWVKPAGGHPAPESTERSLVIAPQWIGDAVMTEPLLRRLHARGERLTVGALPWVAPVYRAMPQVAEVIEFPFAHGGLQLRERLRLARQIDGQFDVAYVCPNSLKSALLPLLAGIPKRVGYLGEARVGLLTHRLKNPTKGQRPPMVAFYSALSGDTDLAQDRPQLQLDAREVDETLSRLGLTRNGYHVFAPGAEYGDAKRWPASHFAELAAQLDLPVLLLGSGKEAELCAEIAQACPQMDASATTGQLADTDNIRDTRSTPGEPSAEESLSAQSQPLPTAIDTDVQRDLAPRPHPSPKQAGVLLHQLESHPSLPGHPSHILNLAGKTSLSQALALISASQCVVSNDSGLMHVAAGFGVRQVAIFGSSSPLHTPPLNDRASVLWLKNNPDYQPPLTCAPCFERTCPLGHTRCLNDIKAQDVLRLI